MKSLFRLSAGRLRRRNTEADLTSPRGPLDVSDPRPPQLLAVFPAVHRYASRSVVACRLPQAMFRRSYEALVQTNKQHCVAPI